MCTKGSAEGALLFVTYTYVLNDIIIRKNSNENYSVLLEEAKEPRNEKQKYQSIGVKHVYSLIDVWSP